MDKGRQQSELQKTAKHAASEFELYLDNININRSDNTKYIGNRLVTIKSFVAYELVRRISTEHHFPCIPELKASKSGILTDRSSKQPSVVVLAEEVFVPE
ncbi:hypothetical protein CEXT_672251 [Caerostris extrusa]|uniref:Uncharacterized protein n=1 Tax=Caerostris extrusa TaxID=172846 RepID=A0AAV4X970_CAEEX|nr:hypothetical protein CEXT_672251 [Caerostris extrusa]